MNDIEEEIARKKERKALGINRPKKKKKVKDAKDQKVQEEEKKEPEPLPPLQVHPKEWWS